MHMFRMSTYRIHGPLYFLNNNITQANLLNCLGKSFQLLALLWGFPLGILVPKSNNRLNELLLLWDWSLTLSHCFFFFSDNDYRL